MPGSLPQRSKRSCRLAFPALLALSLALPAGPLAASTELPLVAPHLTDGQDRLMPGLLSSAGEAKAKANALYAQAVISLETPDGELQTALDQLRQVAALDPHNEDVLVRMANLLLQTGQVESAFEQLQSATQAHPHSVTLEALLGLTQHLRGQNDEALRLSTDALSKDPTQTASMRVLLEIAGAQDDLSGAVLHIEDILQADGPGVPASVWMNLGRLYVEISGNEVPRLSGDTILKTLLPIYQQAAAKPPPDIERLGLLAETYQDLGRKHEALATLRRAIQVEPDNLDILLRSARLEMDLGETEPALKDYQLAYDLNPSLTGLRELLGRLYLDNNKFSDAVRLLHDALADSPQDPELQADLGVAYEGAHQHAQAAEWFQRAFASPACPPEAYLELAVYQIGRGRIKQAGQTLATAHARFPKSAKIRFYEAIRDRYAKNYTAALACLDAMRTLAPASANDVFTANFYLEGALTLSLAGQDARIAPLLREGLARYPDDSDLMNELAFSWADAGDHLPDALALSQRASQLDPENGAIEDTLGWTYFKMGKVNDALPILQQAAIMTNNDPVVLQHLGDALLKMDRKREAIATWRRALAKDPSSHDLTTRIAAALAPANHAYSRSAPHN